MHNVSTRLRGQASERAGRDREGRKPAPADPGGEAPRPNRAALESNPQPAPPAEKAFIPATSCSHARPLSLSVPGGSQAPGICLCLRKNVTLTYLSPQLLSVLFQNDITESNHEIYMGGAGWTGGGAGSCLPGITCGEACVWVSIKYLLPSVCGLRSQRKAASHLLNDRSH